MRDPPASHVRLPDWVKLIWLLFSRSYITWVDCNFQKFIIPSSNQWNLDWTSENRGLDWLKHKSLDLTSKHRDWTWLNQQIWRSMEWACYEHFTGTFGFSIEIQARSSSESDPHELSYVLTGMKLPVVYSGCFQLTFDDSFDTRWEPRETQICMLY